MLISELKTYENMNRKYFGTDGIRGIANQHPMSAELALKLGMAAGLIFCRGKHRHRVVIAKDTRLSGYLIEPALTAGFIAAGMDVFLVGPLPTPAIAMLTRSMRADIGVMISASHNPYHDNGIKLFAPNGHKLSDETELKIEKIIDEGGIEDKLASAENLGRAKRIESAGGRYIEFVKSSFPKGMTLDGLKIVIDCANGAGYKVGPIILRELGAEVIAIGVEPNGFNINKGCGSTDTKLLSEEVVAQGADLGIALDGDADRVIMCDEKGRIVDGDQLMALIATYWNKEGLLKGNAVVATQMSNLGFEKYLGELGVNLIRTNVGDRYVVEGMKKHGCNMGGEQSGHIVLSDYTTTGDGLIAALQAIAGILIYGKKASEMTNLFTPTPQILKNVRFSGANPMERDAVKKAILDAEKELGNSGRIFVRKSGTEPLIRIMLEGTAADEIKTIACDIAGLME